MSAQEASYKQILLTTKATYFDVDKLVSLIVLAKLLAQRYTTKVDIFAQPAKLFHNTADLVSPTNVNFLERLDADHFTISLKRNGVRVKHVKWEENSESIDLHIYTAKGQIDPEQYSMTPGKPHYDLVVGLGINKLNALKKY